MDAPSSALAAVGRVDGVRAATALPEALWFVFLALSHFKPRGAGGRGEASGDSSGDEELICSF